MQVTLSAIKADVGSIGGHTKPSIEMLAEATNRVGDAVRRGFLKGVGL